MSCCELTVSWVFEDVVLRYVALICGLQPHALGSTLAGPGWRNVRDLGFFDLLVAHDVRSSRPTRRINRVIRRIIQHIRTERPRTSLTLSIILRLRKNTILKLRNHTAHTNSHHQQPSNT
jgi:hypothetical protein